MTRIKGITDVFFDLDHTLWDFEKNSALTFRKIFQINSLDIDLESFLKLYTPINFKYWKLYREEQIEKESLRFKRLNETFEALNLQIDDVLIHKISDDYIKYLSTHNYLLAHTKDILNYLQQNYNLHIITNGFEAVQEIKLKGANINHYFNTITNSESTGVKKPNPKIFEFALQQANTKSEYSVMIGDNYEADIVGAINVGMDAILFDIKNNSLNNGVKYVNTLLELKRYL